MPVQSARIPPHGRHIYDETPAADASGRDRRLGRRDDRRLDRQRCAAGDRGRPRRRLVGTAMGVECVSVDTRVAGPHRWLGRGHLRRAACVHDRPRSVRDLFCRLRAVADDRGSHRSACAARSCSRTHGSELTRDHRRRLQAKRARCGDRFLDRLGRNRGDRRPSRRRRDRRPSRRGGGSLLSTSRSSLRPWPSCSSRFQKHRGEPDARSTSAAPPSAQLVLPESCSLSSSNLTTAGEAQ